jgi:Cohesin domain
LNRKRILLWVAIAAAAAAGARWATLPRPAEAPKAAALQAGAGDTRPDASATQGRWSALPKREAIPGPAGQLFVPRSWTPAPAQSPPLPDRAAASKPGPPPMPYRVAGKMLHDGAPQVVLAKGDAVVAAREGETLDDGYRVEAIGRDHVTLLYLPLGVREQLPLTSSFIIDEPQPAATPPAASGPAQLRWAGPPSVKAGDPFSVALKLSATGQGVRAAPLQLSYDAALLEPLDVRPGKSFANVLFSYRIDPEGSILVGASGKETTLPDAELVVLTFKPIRPGATAELKISSMTLQSSAGHAITHDRPAAFRTAIVR